MKNKIIDIILSITIVIFIFGVGFGFYKQVEANRNLNRKIEILQKHNKKISEEVDKLHRYILEGKRKTR
nr:MAG TPA: cell division protein [Caudoviricetes sp.]